MKIAIEGIEFTLKTTVTTLDESMRGVIYRRLMKACRESGDDVLMLLAEDTVPLWNYATALSGVESSSADCLTVGRTGDTGKLLTGFNQWLEMPSRISGKILEAVIQNDYPPTDEEALPGEHLSDEKKAN